MQKFSASIEFEPLTADRFEMKAVKFYKGRGRERLAFLIFY